jgi:excisionase family DNA binding protein
MAAVLTRLGLEPLDDDSADATLWLPAGQPEPLAKEPPGAGEGTMGRLLLTVTEAACSLGVSRSTVYELIGQGDLEVVHLGRAARVPSESVVDLVERMRELPRPTENERTTGRGKLRVLGQAGASQRRAASKLRL